MSIEACKTAVIDGDPARAHATLAAPPEAQAVLWPLYAFNLELARAPFVSTEPMVAEMRLQWWIDTLDRAAAGVTPPHHEVAGPLADLIQSRNLDVTALKAAAESRKRDAWNEDFADLDALLAHLDATAGGLMETAVAALGGADPHQARLVGRAQGAANWLTALAELQARGRVVLPEGVEAAALAKAGLTALAEARALPKLPSAARPALWPAAEAGAVLRLALSDPGRVTAGTLRLSEFSRRWQMLRAAMSGRA